MEPNQICDTACVDVSKHPGHCGFCFNACPGDLCIDGNCIGGPTGHSVVIGMSYVGFTAASRRLLGNALFMPATQHVRILAYRQWALDVAADAVDVHIDQQAMVRGRSYTLDDAPSPVAIAGLLTLQDYDVLLLLDQADMPAVAVSEFAKLAGDAVSDFFDAGGTVVALATSDPMATLLSETQLLQTLGFVPITGGMVMKQAPTDALSVAVNAPMPASQQTAVIVTAEPATPWLSFVFSDSSAAENPVVIHRVVEVTE